MRKFILLLLSCLSSFYLIAQNCGSTELHEHMLQTDPNYEKGLEDLEDQIQYFQKLNALSGNASVENEELLTIPIVFHVIHTGEPIGTGFNVSDANVFDALNRMNENFAAVNGLGANVNIEFCLAINDPQGNPTNGINRVDGSGVPEYTTYGIQHSGDFGASSTDIKDLSRWPTHLYYNVWIVNDIYPTWIAGFANYPNGSDYDGSVVVYNVVNGYSTVLTHELGHGFNLRHTFDGDYNGCPLNEECLEQGDRVCDTPPHQQNDCSTSTCFSGDLTNSIDNYMSYCGGKVLFTQGQKERVRAAALSDPRKNLLLSNGCSPLLANNVSILEIDETIIKTCLGKFYPRIRVLNQGSNVLSSFEVVYQLEGLGTQTQTISTNLAYGEEAWIELDPITYAAGEYLFSATVQTPNGQLDGYTEFDTRSLTVDLGPNIVITPNYIEDFESYANYSFFPPEWSKESYRDGAVINSTWAGISNSVNSSMRSGAISYSINLPIENILIMPNHRSS